MPSFVNPFEGNICDRKLNKEELIRAIRFSIAAEFEAIQIYNQLAESIEDAAAIEILNDIADEEKVHVGELQAVLFMLDPKEEELYSEGKDEVNEELTKKGSNMKFRLDQDLRIAGQLIRKGSLINVTGNTRIPGSEWDEFEEVLLTLSKLFRESDYDGVDSVLDKLEPMLDAPLFNELDGVLFGHEYNQRNIQRALDEGYEREGTEPRAALAAVTGILNSYLSKVNGN